MAKNFFFVPGIVYFWVNNPREVEEFVSITVVLSSILLVRSLVILYDPKGAILKFDPIAVILQNLTLHDVRRKISRHFGKKS